MKNQFEIHSLSKGTSMQAKPYSGAVFLSIGRLLQSVLEQRKSLAGVLEQL